MGLSSLQVCMDSSDWINQGVNHQEENGIDSSSSSPSSTTDHEEKRAARPQNEQQAIIIKCPRCDSTHTKFCYYNNYSLSQPRYFCKTCRRYWTKGGSLRNIPVGGGCRKKNKSVISTKKSYANSDPTGGLHLTFPNLLANSETLGMTNFMERGYSYNAMLENSSRQVDHLLESKLDALLGNTSRRNHDFMGTNDLGFLGGGGLGDEGGTSHGFTHNYFQGLCSPPFEDESNNGSLLPPFQGSEMKPNKHNFSLDWQDNGGAEVGKDSIGYLDGIGSWNAIMNGYECSQQCD